MPVIPVLFSVVTFGVVAWGFDKALKAITGRDLKENLDTASDNVIAFVRPKEKEE
jgi:hypothetical protein